jgi:hypothetical protein
MEWGRCPERLLPHPFLQRVILNWISVMVDLTLRR